MKYLAIFLILMGILILFGSLTMGGTAKDALNSYHWKYMEFLKKNGQASTTLLFYGIMVTVAGIGLWIREKSV